MFLKQFSLILYVLLAATANPSLAVVDSTKTINGYYIINNIYLSGNKITKPHIIFRELTFSKGDVISSVDLEKRLERSRQNLLNTSLFNFVTISMSLDSNKVDITINMVERWYIFPVPIFEIAERNFNTWWETKNFARANYGFYVIKENFRGRKESLSFRLRLGYSEQYGFSYQIPYVDKKQKKGLAFSSYYYRGNEIAYQTDNNKLVFYKDESKYIREEYVSRVAYIYRQGLYHTHIINFRHNKANIADTIQSLNSDYFIKNQAQINFLSLSYFFKRDFRDFKIYPLRGYYFDFEIAKLGIGVLKNEHIDITNLYASYRKYWKLNNRIYLASSIEGKYSPNIIQPYYTQRALGYGDYVRGYEYYVIDGSSYGLMKTGIKYELVKPHVQKIPYLNAEKFDTFHYAFYIELFSDFAYVENRMNQYNNNLTNTFIYGSGIGIDFVTYYDNVFRIEYSFNRKGESGIFIHLYAPI